MKKTSQFVAMEQQWVTAKPENKNSTKKPLWGADTDPKEL
jgi:hypothetical protein